MEGWPLRHGVPDFDLAGLIRAGIPTEAARTELLQGLEQLTPDRRTKIARQCWSSIVRDYVQAMRTRSAQLVDAAQVAESDLSNSLDSPQLSALVVLLDRSMANHIRQTAAVLGVEPAALEGALTRELASLLHPTLHDLATTFVVGRAHEQEQRSA